MLNEETIREAQDYLTVAMESGVKKILNIELLLRRHPPEEVVNVLRLYFGDKQKHLKKLIFKDKTNPDIDSTIGTMFRIEMAITSIEREVRDLGGTQTKSKSKRLSFFMEWPLSSQFQDLARQEP